MRDLIKRILREEYSQSNVEDDVIEKLKNYQGTDNFINSIKSQISRGLSKKQADAVKGILFKDIILKKGIAAYNNMIDSDKKFFLKNKDIVIGNPDKNWQEKNIKDLEDFRDTLNPHFLFKDIQIKDKKLKVIDFIENEMNTIGTRSGFIEKGGWSSYNKIDTNYSNWINLILKYDNDNKLGSGTFESKIDNFFKERPIGEVLNDKQLNYINSLGKEIGKEIFTISYADYEMMIELFRNENLIKNKIERTTGIGDAAEKQFFDLLKIKVPEGNFYNFSEPGNIVDMVFGVDGMVKMKKKGEKSLMWYPVQIKNNPELAKNIKAFNIGGISIFPNQDGFGYYESKNDKVPGNFFEDFSFGKPEIPSWFDYFGSQGIK